MQSACIMMLHMRQVTATCDTEQIAKKENNTIKSNINVAKVFLSWSPTKQPKHFFLFYVPSQKVNSSCCDWLDRFT